MRRPIKQWTAVFAAAMPLGIAAGRSPRQTEPTGSADQPLATQPPAFTAAPWDPMSAPMPRRTPSAYRSPGARPPLRADSARGATGQGAPARAGGDTSPSHTGGRRPR